MMPLHIAYPSDPSL